ncbi:MAG: EutN/CcmL family microcompartment protein [Acidimicrobiia bacterium]|nr:EutN/CcmL family microcompartment protein [Acidimicrobiia bacterium]
MKVGRVSGTVVSTVNIDILEGKRLLVCDLLDAEGRPTSYTIALDVVDAGVGETVLILDEGNSARQILGRDWGAIRAVVVGVIDELVVDGETRSL